MYTMQARLKQTKNTVFLLLLFKTVFFVQDYFLLFKTIFFRLKERTKQNLI